jgi:hypothetical protein
MSILVSCLIFLGARILSQGLCLTTQDIILRIVQIALMQFGDLAAVFCSALDMEFSKSVDFL